MLKKILNNPVVMTWASNIVTFGSAFLITPLIIKVYSDIEQSFYWLVWTIIGFTMLADSGFGSALVRAVSYFRGGATYLPKNKKEYDTVEHSSSETPNYEKLKDLLTTTFPIYLVLSVISVILSSVGLVFIWNILEMSGHRIDLWITYFLIIPTSFLMIMNLKWSSFMRGLDFVAMEAKFTTFIDMVRVVIYIVLLIFGMSPLYLVLVLLIVTLFKYLYIRSFVLKWFRSMNMQISVRGFFDKEIFGSLWPQSWRLAGIFWGNYLVEYGNSIIIAQISDVRMMANFLFTTNIINFVKRFAQTPVNAHLPTIYKMGAQKNIAGIKEKVSYLTITSVLIFIAGALMLGYLGNPLLDILGKHGIFVVDRRFLDTGLLLLMAITLFLDMHASIHASIYSSTNHIPFLIPSIVSGVVIVAVGYYILPFYGVLGILMVRFIVQFSFNNWFAVILSLKFLNWPILKYLYELPFFGSKLLIKKTKAFISK